MPLRKILNILFILIFNIVYLHAQVEFAPLGAKWCYLYKTQDGVTEGAFLLSSEADTIIDAEQGKKLRGQMKNLNADYSIDAYNDNYYLFQRNDSVFFTFNGSKLNFFLFATSNEEGDLINSSLFNAEFQVNSVDRLRYEDLGVEIATWELTSNPAIKALIYSHIGPDRGFIEMWGSIVLPDRKFELVGYEDSSLGKFLVSSQACFALFDDREEPELPKSLDQSTCVFTVMPNPVSDKLELKVECNVDLFREFSLRILDRFGKVLYNEDIGFSESTYLDVSDLADAMYFGILERKDEYYPFTFIKIRG